MLVTMKQILDAARADGYGITAPNINNEDTLRAAIEAAEENRSAMILDVGYAANQDIVFFGRMIETFAKAASVPVCINLDHGAKYEHAIWAIRAGFTSIMVDRSTLPYEENVAQVAELTKIAHAVDVSVEAELGHVGQGAQYAVDRDAALTDPEQAADYVARTGIDALAVAIGTAHGEYKGTPYLDFPLLAKLAATVDVPLVLHGGSGTGDENLARATREGINKVNLATDLYKAGAQQWNDEGCVHAGPGYKLIKAGYKDKLVHYMKLFNQCNRY
jgi:fructose-bisphosphate aldolase class II